MSISLAANRAAIQFLASEESGTFVVGLAVLVFDHNSGTSSFFINLADNSFLDNDFTVFAQIPNMTSVDAIMAMPQVDLRSDPNFGADPGNLFFQDVPLVTNKLVIITRAFVVPEPGCGTLTSIALAAMIGLPRSIGCRRSVALSE